MTDDLGTLVLEDGTYTIRFERTLAFPPAEVWAALTEPDRLREWLADAAVVPGPGDSVTLDFGADGGTKDGKITAWEPPRTLAYEWNFVGEKPSHVRFELSPQDAGTTTRLVLEHTRLERASGSGYGAGWHAHLDLLAGHLQHQPVSWSSRFEALLPEYERLAEASGGR
jgi:uncharacterized protein YndB with AHSA1/START domain